MAALLATALFLAGPAGAQDNPRLGGVTRQSLTFEAGTQLVSLRVLPDDASLDAIFGDAVRHVEFVKDVDGRTYFPSHGVRDLQSWDWRQALVVRATAPFTITVEGPRVLPSSEIPLEAGWRWLPALVESEAAPEVAFGSLGRALGGVLDGRGRAAKTVTPGRGYRIYVSDRAVLVGPGTPGGPSTPPASGKSVRVPTIADALALSDLAPGQTVVVKDPVRGGTFRVTDSACLPDGGTCFVPLSVSTATTADLGDAYRFQRLYDGEGDGAIDAESLRLFYGPGSEDSFHAVQLHGQNGGGTEFDLATGSVKVGNPLRTRTPGPYRVAYRYTTAPLRLERQPESLTLEGRRTQDYVRPEWWGATPLPDGDRGGYVGPDAVPGPDAIRFDDPDYDATDEISTAIEVARARYASTNREHYAVIGDFFGYSGTIQLRDGAPLKGLRDGVRTGPGDADRQGLMVLAGTAWHSYTTSYLAKRNRPTAFDEPASPQDFLFKNGERWIVVRQGREDSDTRMVDLELDGNLAENIHVFASDYATASGPSSAPRVWPSAVHEWYRNTGNWTGVATTQGVRDAPKGRIRLINVHVHDYGNSTILGNDQVHFGGSRDLRLGNTVNNHLLYGTPTAPGTSIDGVEAYGFAYGTMVDLYSGHLQNVSVEITTTRNPIAIDFIGVVGHRYSPSNLEDMEAGRGYIPYHEYGEDVTIDGLDVHFAVEGRGNFFVLRHVGGAVSYSDVTVTGLQADSPVMMNWDWYSSRPSSFRLENVNAPWGGQLTSSSADRSDVRDVVVATGGNHEPFSFRPGRRDVRAVATVYNVKMGDVGGSSSTWANRFAKVAPVKTHASGFDLYVRDSELAYRWEPITYDLPDGWSREMIQVYVRDSRLRRVRSGDVRTMWFDGVTVADGRTSEAKGSLSRKTLVANEGGTGYVDVDAPLFVEPQADEYVKVTGTSAGRFEGWTNVGSPDAPVLRLQFTGTDPVTVDWEAAVRPIPDGVVFPD